jgi:hypothetical protein
MTIYEIKRKVDENGSYYFSRKTMKCFGQTLKDFKVKKEGEKFRITAPVRDRSGKHQGYSERLFNPITNKLELI